VKYLLDTNVCIQYLNGRSENIRRHIQTRQTETLTLCAIVKAELFYGVLKSANPDKNLERLTTFINHFSSLPFDDSTARTYGHIRSYLEYKGMPIDPNDLMIAAIAIAHNLILVTHNTREFNRVPDLMLEDWEI